MAELKVARSRRGIARATITQLKKHIMRLEGVSELLKADRQTVQSLKEKVQALDITFKEHHHVIAYQAEDQAAVITEQDLLDKHQDKVFSYNSRLHQLLKEPEPTLSTNPKMDCSQHLCR